MRLRADKCVMWVVNLLLASATAAAVLVFAEQIHQSGWPWFSRVLACWPIVLCFIAGVAASQGNTLIKTLACVVSLLAAAALMFFTFPARDLGHCLYMGLGALAGVYLYFIGLRGDEPYPPRMAIITIVALLVQCAYFFRADLRESTDITSLASVTLVTFVLSMYSFNTSSVNAGLHNTKSGQSMRVPAGLRAKNLLLLTLFLAVTILIASIRPLRQVLSAAVKLVITLVGKFVMFLATEKDIELDPNATPEPTPEPEDLGPIPEIEVNPALATTFYIMMGMILLLALIVMVALILSGNDRIKLGRRGGRREGFWAKFFKKRKETEYDDSVERLLDWQGFVQARRKAASKLLERLTQRPQRIDDMPDDRAKLRFAYYSLLRSPAGRDIHRSLTPLEVGSRQRAATLERLAEDYSTVRYDEDSTPETAQVDNARRAMGDMRRRIK